ncbi:CCA tRNA nucleotidyltransferase [Caulobacter sp. NIBR2454]|uniref:CCA tRNA nucleotidyltransferase n=1 Tax=Caulobacter sp. NIBR2454 TaxID=3015996 RepID=UPI0022B6373C|nr:CCA tRNA nucleotidyltransferase [Caulobacter sp. NIBR2454]
MSDPATQAVINALEAAGGAGCARFVGGCVRNTLLNRPVDDIDIATSLLPDQTIKAIEAAGLRAIPTGIEHGTVTAISNSRPFEITTLRHDVETDGRHAVVAFTDDWAQDAARRDFRLNALYADATGLIFDPTGEGVADAKAGRIVFVGDPATRIEEDYLRILRFFRFFALYGRGDADAAALAACAAAKEMLARCSAERIAKELLKLLAADDPRPAVRLMAASGVLGVVLPEAGSLARFEGLVEVETEQLFTCDPDLRLAALAAGDEAAVGAMADRLRLSNAQKSRLQAAAGQEPRIVSWMSPREARRTIYALGQNTFADRIKLAWAAADRSAVTPQWRGLLALAETWTPPPFPISGDEILSAGVPKGPLVGQVRREVETWWIDQDFLDDKFSVIERLKAVAQGLAY